MDKGLMYFYFAPRIMLSKENYLYSFLTLAGTYLTTYIIDDVVIKLLRDEVIQTKYPYAILIPY